MGGPSSRQDIVGGFQRLLRRSRRALLRYRKPDSAQIESFVTDLYGAILRREPDTSGFSNHVARLGRRPTFHDARAMLSVFLNSDEAVELRAAETSLGISWDPPEQEAVRTVMSLGTHCLTSSVLKTLGLKTFSAPFDWIFSNAAMVAHCIRDDFRTFLDPNQHEFVAIENRTVPSANFCEHRFYKDKFGVKTVFNHYDITTKEHYDYYVRCVDRFRATLRSRDRTLLVMVTRREMMREDDFSGLCAALEPFPKAELLVVRASRRPNKFGGELAMSEGRHKLHDLYLIGDLGTVSFPDKRDEAMFRHILAHYRFDLAAPIP